MNNNALISAITDIAANIIGHKFRLIFESIML